MLVHELKCSSKKKLLTELASLVVVHSIAAGWMSSEASSEFVWARYGAMAGVPVMIRANSQTRNRYS